MSTRKSTIDFSTILKRSNCMNSILSETSNDLHDQYYDNFMSAISKSKDGKDYNVNNTMNLYVESMSNVNTATKYYYEPLRLLSEIRKNDLNELESMFESLYMTRIIPYVENTVDIIDDIDRFNISESSKDNISTVAKRYSIADRILKNHRMLTEKYESDFKSTILNKYKLGGVKEAVYCCANYIDNYPIPNYQKMNITLEETYYVLNNLGIQYDKSDLAKYVAEYYLLSDFNLSDKDMDNYKRTLQENYILSTNDMEPISYLFEDFDITSVNSGIESFLKTPNKTPELFKETVDSILKNSTKSNLLSFIDEFYDFTTLGNKFSKKVSRECAESICKYINEEFENNRLTREDLDAIIHTFNEDAYSDISEIRNIIYESSNLLAIEYVNSNGTELALNEFKIFKFHNLITAAFNLDKFLKVKERKIMNNGKSKLSKLMKKTKSVLFGESVATCTEKMMNYIGEDHKAEITLRQYVFDEDEEVELSKFLSNICEEYNDLFRSQCSTCRCYYIINPGIAEIKIKDPARIQLENDDAIFEAKDGTVDLYIDILAESTSFFDEYSFPTSDDDEDDDEDDEDEEEDEPKKPEVNKPKVGGAVNKKDDNKDSSSNNDSNKKKAKDDDKLPKLDPPKGKLYKASINLNSIRLGLEGLKAKFKDLDTKQKEASKNMDNAARAFAKGVKDSLVSDRREAIIKGSIIPSFSRLMKNAIILAGVAYFSLPAAVIGAMGALALSAKLTKQERALLLDEIETELEVVDKELAIADSNNQINKYRELLKYKKNLQRQYQRIRYNIRVGKDILPGSASGIPNRD